MQNSSFVHNLKAFGRSLVVLETIETVVKMNERKPAEENTTLADQLRTDLAQKDGYIVVLEQK